MINVIKRIDWTGVLYFTGVNLLLLLGYIVLGALLSWIYLFLTGEGFLPFLSDPQGFIISSIILPAIVIYCGYREIMQGIEEKQNEVILKFLGKRVTPARLIGLLFLVPIIVNLVSAFVSILGFAGYAAGLYSIRYAMWIVAIPVVLAILFLAKNEPYFIEDEDGNIKMNK